jgi:hypothetical protein
MPTHFDVPDILPVLSAGKHRRPRQGACFMELAAYLAGERWSDHPKCTHPLLATLARCVNDLTSDAARPRLAPLIPSVIGLTSDDLHVDARIALLSARTALPVVAEERQRVLAVAVLSSERVLAQLDGRPHDDLSETSRDVLATVPHAAQWAVRFSDVAGAAGPRGFRRFAAPCIVTSAAQGIAVACVADADDRLRALLTDAIEECKAMVHPTPVEHIHTWDDACRLTGVS